jgi:hypothetical protein
VSSVATVRARKQTVTGIAIGLGLGLPDPPSFPYQYMSLANQKAEDWPPDEQGFLDGVGLNIPPSSVSPQPLPAGQSYDFMSYCANDADAWISPKGWDEVMGWAPRTSLSRCGSRRSRQARRRCG